MYILILIWEVLHTFDFLTVMQVVPAVSARDNSSHCITAMSVGLQKVTFDSHFVKKCIIHHIGSNTTNLKYYKLKILLNQICNIQKYTQIKYTFTIQLTFFISIGFQCLEMYLTFFLFFFLTVLFHLIKFCNTSVTCHWWVLLSC